MLLVSTEPLHHAFVDHHVSSHLRTSVGHQPRSQSSEATSSTLLSSFSHSMERGAPEYSQSGLPSPYPSNFGDTQSETSSADHASAAQYSSQQEVRSNNYSTSATPTSEYSVYPPSARSSTFPDHIQRSYHPASNPSGSSGGMAQTPTSPSMPLQQNYPQSGGGMYAQPRPDWGSYGHPGGQMPQPHHVFPHTPTSAAPPGRPAQVGDGSCII